MSIQLITKLGEISISPMGLSGIAGYHLYASYDKLMVGKIPCRGSVHLFLWSDNVFRVGREVIQERHGDIRPTSNYDRRMDIYCRRTDKPGLEDASQHCRDTISDMVYRAVNEWYRFDSGAHMALYSAEQVRMQELKDKALSAIGEKLEELNQAQGRLEKISGVIFNNVNMSMDDWLKSIRTDTRREEYYGS